MELHGDRRDLSGRLLPAAIATVVVAAVGVGAMVVRGGGHEQPAVAGAAPHFVDDTAGAGVDLVYAGDFDFFVGGGVATFDCDGDGFEDLYVAGGANRAALFRNASEVGGALRFERVASAVTDLARVTGAYPLDVDSDGTIDLSVLRNGGNVLLRGLGGCRFEPAGEALGLDAGDAWTVGFSATWEGGNRLPTLAYANYLVPGTDDCDASELLRPSAAGRYAPPVPLRPGYCALSALFSDWSRTGRPDLRLANDRHYAADAEEQLWRIEPGAPPRAYTADDGWEPLRIWGMGIASEDITGDGHPEVVLTSQGDNKLQTLDTTSGAPTFRDIALRSGTTAQRPYLGGDVLPSTAWHPEFGDVNDDGHADLLITKGNVDAQPGFAVHDPDNLLIGAPDGTFHEGGGEAGIADLTASRGAALTDLNLDGLLDLVVVHRDEPVSVRRNVGLGTATDAVPMGHWLQLRLVQPAPNVFAVGAWVEVRVDGRTITREVTVGGGHASGELGWIHVGLGAAERVSVRVQWPDGRRGPWSELRADQFVTLSADADPEIWVPSDHHVAS